jgi:hypothetical protein
MFCVFTFCLGVKIKANFGGLYNKHFYSCNYKKIPIGDVLMLLFLHSGEGITLNYITRMGVKKERKKKRKKERNQNILILT